MHPNFDARSFSIRALHDTTCAAWCAHTIDDRTSRLFCCCILRQNRVKSYAQLVQISFNVSWRLVFIPSRYAGLCLEHISITAVEFSKSCIFFFFLTFLLSSLWTSRGRRCRPIFPPDLTFNFLSCIGVSNPAARRFFIGCIANSRSRAFRNSICAQEKVPTNFLEYSLGGARTHETDPYQARG